MSLQNKHITPRTINPWNRKQIIKRWRFCEANEVDMFVIQSLKPELHRYKD